MKNILKKIRIHYLTYIFILLCLLGGLFKQICIIYLIIIIHELGHIIMAKLLRFKIDYVIIYPFGGYTLINKDINTLINKDILLSIGGVLNQILLGFIIIYIYNLGYIRNYNYELFNMYNRIIILFNLLPIVPLDGYRIIKNIFEKFFSVRTSYIVSVVISFICLLVLIIYTIMNNMNNYMVIIFIVYKIVEEIRNYKYFLNKFYLERYLNNYSYNKIKIINSIKYMYKEKYHIFINKGDLIKEKDYLAIMFDNMSII